MRPNLFSFATSELSQDAMLAYLLAWAAPECRNTDSKLHELGTAFLRALMTTAAKAKGIVSPLEGQEIRKLKVGRQLKNIDVYAEINDDLFLLIEDKVHTHEHGAQISRYETLAPKDRQVFAVYVKTGDESISRQRSGQAGVFLREEILAILERHPATGNAIVDEFTAHLKSWQERAEIYASTTVKDWQHFHGFYKALETQLNAHGHIDTSWAYVSNPTGGFLGFFWHFGKMQSQPFSLYLQIESNPGRSILQIRACGAKTAEGKDTEVTSPMQHHALSLLVHKAKEPRFQFLHLHKSGRFKGGAYAGVARVSFAGSESWIATDTQGHLDWTQTLARLKLLMSLVDEVTSATHIIPANTTLA